MHIVYSVHSKYLGYPCASMYYTTVHSCTTWQWQLKKRVADMSHTRSKTEGPVSREKGTIIREKKAMSREKFYYMMF